jgi:DNA-binding transcriptional LysR family regulator
MAARANRDPVNIHHLELFYYVARYRGVSAAARQMPYGIQQSTISSQVLQLEDALGKTLFRRRPFALTPEGEVLYAFVEPFFGGVAAVAERVRGGAANHLRIGCPEIVQRDYLPALLAAVRARLPGFHFTLHSGRSPHIEEALAAGGIDAGFSTLSAARSPEVRYRELLRLPMVLLVPRSSDVRSADALFARDRIESPLITLPSTDPVCVLFQRELRKRKIDWYPALELASLELVARYVAEGYGVGLGVAVPGGAGADGVRALPLPGFAEIGFGVYTAARRSPVVELFVSEAARVAAGLSTLATASAVSPPAKKKRKGHTT